jgi:hypothetical protein
MCVAKRIDHQNDQTTFQLAEDTFESEKLRVPMCPSLNKYLELNSLVLLIGIGIYDTTLILRTQEAVNAFAYPQTHDRRGLK